MIDLKRIKRKKLKKLAKNLAKKEIYLDLKLSCFYLVVLNGQKLF